MKIFLIRHGQTDWNLQKKIQGSTDISLNERGIEQAMERAEYFFDENIIPDNIYCSDKKRAIKTAEILGDKFNLRPIIIEDIEEVNLGNWEGMKWYDIEKNFPIDFSLWEENPRTSNVHGGESYLMVMNRVIKKLKEICQKEKEKDTIFVVTHGAVIMTVRLFLENKNWINKKISLIPRNLEFVEIDENEIINY